jgi:hypothetical protein
MTEDFEEACSQASPALDAPVPATTASPAWTEGPWEVIEPDENGQAVVKGRHTEVATCWHHCVVQIEKQMHANAALIAAAPDLAKALKFALEMLHADERDVEPHEYSACVEDAIREGEAALAKARGEQS